MDISPIVTVFQQMAYFTSDANNSEQFQARVPFLANQFI